MSNQNGGKKRGYIKPVTVRAVRKPISEERAVSPKAVPFDFGPAENNNMSAKAPQTEPRKSAIPRFASNDDLRFSDVPAGFAAGFSGIDDDGDEGIDEKSRSVSQFIDKEEAHNAPNADELDFYSGIDEMNKKKTVSKTAAKTAVQKKKAAAAAAARKKKAKRRKLLKKILIAVTCIAVVAVSGTVVYFKFVKGNSPYMVQSGFAEINTVNINTLLQKGIEDSLNTKKFTVNVNGKAYDFALADYDFGYVPGGEIENKYIETEMQDGSYRVDKISAIESLCFNETAIRAFINTVASEHGTPMVMPSYTIDGATLNVTAGKDGMSIDYSELTKQLVNRICSGGDSMLNMEVAVLPAPEVDIEQIYHEVKCDPVDATVSVGDDGVAVYTDEIIGKDFNLDSARISVEAGGTSWKIPLALTNPGVTVQKLKAPSCPDTLSTCSTKYSEGNANRASNVKLAGKNVNGLVLQPGEVFSFNNTVGKRTPERGFKSATVYSGEGLDEDYGGGICQTSSTIYYAAIKANLEIVQRVNHYFTVGYWNLPGADATVSWGGPDLKIKNNKEYPIKFVIESGNGRITCKVTGTNTDNTEAYFEHDVIKTIKYETITKVPVKGKSNKNTSGANGMVVKTYRVVKQNGKEISRKLEATSTYRPLNAVVYDKSLASSAPVTTPAPTTTTPAPEQATTEG